MPIDCVWFAEMPDGPWQPGWAFPFGYALSEHYKANVAEQRRPISVCVPTRTGRCTPFCIDSHPTDKPDAAWQVTIAGELVEGERPDITVTPSIHCIGLYHGFLTNGVLTDDSG
jgi:hypothetical protein